MLLDALERIAFAAVAVTTAALDEGPQRDLTFLGWRALVVLGEAGHPVRISDLGIRLGLSRPSVSKLVRRLERHGLVDRSADAADGRVLLVTLSPRGSEVRAAVVARRRDLLATAMRDPLPPSLAAGREALATRLEPWI